MKSPFTGGEAALKRELRTLEYRKDQFEIIYHYYVCEDTHEQFTTTELDALNITQVHNKYRAKYGIPFTDEIKSIREKYGLSAAKMSEVLGLGINVFRQYENGEIPSVATGRLIRLAENPEEFRKLLEISRNTFEKREYNRVLEKVQLIDKETQIQESLYQYIFGNKYPSLQNGFRMPDIDKIGNMVLFFAQENKPFTTALNKLLFYADFSHFKNYGAGISGISYKAIQHGPIPANYGSIYNYLVNQAYVKVAEVGFNDFVGDQYYTDKIITFKEEGGPFSATELATLKKVSTQFQGMTTKQIVDFSHEELAWKNNVDDYDRISYEYGFELKYVD